MSREIHVAGMPRCWVALKALEAIAEEQDRWFGSISHWMEVDRLCWAVECMKHIDDSPSVFPGGKWATIQHLQALIDQAASDEVRRKK